MLERLQTMFGYDSPQMVHEKPTIIMDRGIATKENIALLHAQEYQYVVITREDQSKEYLAEFETARDTFTRIDDLSRKHTAYGDENHVYVNKVEEDGENVCRVLCLSDGKARKENAIVAKKDAYFII